MRPSAYYSDTLSVPHLVINGYPETVDGDVPLEGVPARGDVGVPGDLHAGEHDALVALVAVAEVDELGAVGAVVALEQPGLDRHVTTTFKRRHDQI